LAFLAVAWLLGVAAAAATHAEAGAAVAAFGLLGALAFTYRPGALTLTLVLISGGVILAATWRYQDSEPALPPDSIARLNNSDAAVRFRGVIDDEPGAPTSARRYRLDVREALVDGRWQDVSGRVLVYTQPWTNFAYGDLLEVQGKLKTPEDFSGFDYREYLLRQGIVSTVSHPDVSVLSRGNGSAWREDLIDIRSRLSFALAEVLPEPEASLAGGILFGTRSAIPADLTDNMRATGTSHLVAVSGQNVTIAAALMIAVFGWVIGRRNACWGALAGIFLYAALVGAQPSVIRAAIMGGLWVMSIALGRQNTALVALSLAAAGMTALDPQVVHEVGFQLSFAAVLGLILVTPVLNHYIDRLSGHRPSHEGSAPIRVARDVLTMTLASIAFTLPIAAINFQQVSLAAPFANLFAVPAFLAVAATSGLAAVLALVIPGEAAWLSVIAWPPAAYMIGVVRLFAGLPGASVQITGVHTSHAVVFYALLAGLLYWASRHRIELPVAAPPPRSPRRPFMVLPGFLAFVLALTAAAVWVSALSRDDAPLSVTFLDVGQGDATLIESPSGQRILIDGGPSAEAVSDALGRNLPFYDRRIDLVILTHPQADHLAGLSAVLDRYHVGGLMTTRFTNSTALYDEWREDLADSDIPTATATRGHWIDLGDGARLTVLSPTPETRLASAADINDTSIVLRLAMGDVSFLLTADISGETESTLIRLGTDLRSTVLKVPHHGSGTSASPDFLSRVHPLIDVVSAGADNPYGHPAPEVLARLDGDAIFRTDKDGDITLSTDGKRLWVETQR
ncbi:MAG TPA: DNA internalization-related competence protein ComEC/Rec2, partial [Dehalococcoidia bacterium]|nr:DNA internalization-related competence protein ComEC/Rec2 [Dehalococcoidia bacterium]